MFNNIKQYCEKHTFLHSKRKIMVGQIDGALPVGDVLPGAYVMRFTTEKGCVVRKVMVSLIQI